MEVKDDESSRSMSSLLLYCDEDPFVSTPPATTTEGGSQQSGAAAVDGCAEQQPLVPDDEADHLLMMDYKARERCYAPTTDYLHRLMVQGGDHHALLSTARSKGVHYIIYAFARLGLAAATAFNAVNYLDRFLSINCHLSWEVWMVEVVSVACLSVACKLEEVNIPSLHDLQMEEVMSHSFRPSTIRDMELTLLKALQWRLACVTPYSFLHLLLPHNSTPATASRCTRLLLCSLSEPSLLRFDASAVAASALRCVLEALKDHAHLSGHLIRPLCQLDNEADECFSMMKALDTSLDLSNNHHKYSDQQSSPISVIPFETDGTVNRSAVSRRLFGRSTTPDHGTQDKDKPHIQARDEVISQK